MKSNNDEFKLNEVRVRLVPGIPLTSQTSMSTPEAAVEVIGNFLSDMDREVFLVVNVDAKLRPINFNIVSIGAIEQTIVSPREVLKSGILSNACGIMVFHNHPSSELLPSKEDTIMTDRLSRVCNDIGIRFVDHIIVGPNKGEYFSFASKRILPVIKDDYARDYHELSLKVAEKGRTR